MSLDEDLIAYYDAEARGGHRRTLGPLRTDLRTRFVELLGDEGRSQLVDVGAGPGLDSTAFVADGVDVVGVDLTHANSRVAADAGCTAITGSLYRLPFRDESFDALWTMSTFVHVPHERFDEAMSELVRVVRPGSPLGVGTWGGLDFEGVPGVGEIQPPRFFSLASHERWRAMLSRHGDVEHFEAHGPFGDDDWEYQFAVVRSK